MNFSNNFIKKIFSIILILVLTQITNNTQAYRFVIYSDSRAPKADWGVKPFPYDLFNKDVLDYINNKVSNLDPKPDFAIFIGDMINRAYPKATPADDSRSNLQYWKDYMTTGLINIPLYVAVGNSDLYGTTWWTEFPLQTEFAQTFSNMPANGPTSPTDFTHLVYSFEHADGQEKSLFVILDSFGIYGASGTHCDNDYDPYGSNDEQINWFSAQATSSSANHKFVIAHGPAFSVIGFPVGRNVKKIWNVALQNNFDTFFCAHEHLFYRWNVNQDTYPTYTGTLIQNLSGTSGAVPDSATNVLSNPGDRIYFGYNFLVVDVEGNNITERAYAVIPDGVGGYTTKLIDTTMICK